MLARARHFFGLWVTKGRYSSKTDDWGTCLYPNCRQSCRSLVIPRAHLHEKANEANESIGEDQQEMYAVNVRSVNMPRKECRVFTYYLVDRLRVSKH
jgi:hypothetical protein